MFVTETDLVYLTQMLPREEHVASLNGKRWEDECVWQKFATFKANMKGKPVTGAAFYDFGYGYTVVVVDGNSARGSKDGCFLYIGDKVAIAALKDSNIELLFNPAVLTDVKLETVPLKEPE